MIYLILYSLITSIIAVVYYFKYKDEKHMSDLWREQWKEASDANHRHFKKLLEFKRDYNE